MTEEKLNGDVLLSLHNASVGYRGRSLVTGISLDVKRREVLALVGPNGSGKTTLLYTLLGLIPPLHGELVRKPGLKVGYVAQRGQHDPIFPVSALDVVRGGGPADKGRKSEGILSRIRLASADEAVQVLERLGLGRIASFPYRDLSGGQQQRVLLARALVREPDVLALDEPTAGMDLPAERDMLDLVSSLADEAQMAVILVTHQLWVAARYADRLALLNSNDRSFTLDKTELLFNSQRLSSLFGRRMYVTEAERGRFVTAGSTEDKG